MTTTRGDGFLRAIEALVKQLLDLMTVRDSFAALLMVVGAEHGSVASPDLPDTERGHHVDDDA
ncbi:hypothetical protein [Natrinema sp. 74]|uniref:hypothetical protein n=1 Tax=Natrinema sp. 74 TaxID=3384159 RepID=UPI0038D4C78C